MAESAREWYYVIDDADPVGPLSVEEMLHAWIHDQIKPTTPCTRQDMKGWTPICETPPFSKFWQRVTEKRLVSYRCKCGNRIIMSTEHTNSLARCKNCGKVFMVPEWPGHDDPADVSTEVPDRAEGN